MKKTLIVLPGVALALAAIMYFTSTNGPAPVPASAPAPVTVCYSMRQEATEEAPYQAEEMIKIEVDGYSVEGEKKGMIEGPDMSAGYEGKLSGTYYEDEIRAQFAYVIEGSFNKEAEEYQMTGTGLVKKRWPLVEDNGILFPDKSEPYREVLYIPVSCDNI